MIKKKEPEFRKDLVSGDWVLVSPGRRFRPDLSEEEKGKTPGLSEKTCAFEDPQKSGNPLPILWYPRPGIPEKERKNLSSWFVQVVPNKYPLLEFPFAKSCPTVQSFGPQETLKGTGFHEIIITRDHFKTIDKMSLEEVDILLAAYQARYQALANEPCVNYILIFHNHGSMAGASISHPHSQLVAVPIIDPDLSSSLTGARDFYEKNKKCVHCSMLEWERKQKVRIIYENKHFVTLAPFAPRVSYEARIYPLEHSAHFEEMSDQIRFSFADSLRDAIIRIIGALDNPDYNFFIHTVPPSMRDHGDYYHWHMEILPRVFKWAGLELGAGIEVVVVPPEEAAENLRKIPTIRPAGRN